MRALRRVSRRQILQGLAALFVARPAWTASPHSSAGISSPFAPVASRTPEYAPVVPGYEMRFPYDEGAHPAFRTEWWYITGWLEPRARRPIGFQITFFRVRAEVEETNPSAFAPRQIIIAHAALSDAAHGKLVHDQKLARASLGLAGAAEGRTDVWIDDWRLAQEADLYRLQVPADDFTMNFTFTRTQPPLIQGDGGVSRKGPQPESASYYYSIPQLAVSGRLVERQRSAPVTGRAWLDHEWSSSYMDERASGWDWVGINFEDGGALMAFRMRDRAGGKFWAGGAYRSGAGVQRVFASDEVVFVPLRVWRSPRTGASYPIAWRIEIPGFSIAIEPLMDDQENDTRASVGTVYWEGAVTATVGGRPAGRGYLELTGYWRRMKL